MFNLRIKDYSAIKPLQCLSLLLLVFSPIALGDEVDEQKNQIIQVVRSGDIEAGYNQLTLLHLAYPDNQSVIYDLIEVAARAGYPEKSLEYGNKIQSLDKTPSYALEYLAKSLAKWAITPCPINTISSFISDSKKQIIYWGRSCHKF